ncbi:hypothetical protein H7Y63_01325, partial [Polaromonas sp.]|nr:hypothetical protein [Candidatus Saccharibacteria bacterium]
MKSCSNCSFPETLALADLSLAAVVHTAGLLVTEAIMADKAPDSPRGAGQDTV